MGTLVWIYILLAYAASPAWSQKVGGPSLIPNSFGCYGTCGNKGGQCSSVCGEGGYCCRKGHDDCPKYLADLNPSGRHACIRTNGPRVIADFTRRPPVSCSALLDKKKVGCFKEGTDMKLIHTARDISSPVSVGYWLNWRNFPHEVMRLVCGCEKKAKEMGYTFFSLRFWAECWAGNDTPDTVIGRDNCVNERREACANADSFCIGTVNSEYMYRVTLPKPTETSATAPQTSGWVTGVQKTTTSEPISFFIPSYPLGENGP